MAYDLPEYFMSLVEEEYDNKRRYDGEEEAKQWVNDYHKTEIDTADFCSEFLDNYVTNKELKYAMIGTIDWEQIWKHLLWCIENWEE